MDPDEVTEEHDLGLEHMVPGSVMSTANAPHWQSQQRVNFFPFTISLFPRMVLDPKDLPRRSIPDTRLS